MILKELLASTPVYEIYGRTKKNIEGLCIRTEDVRPNYLYIYIDDGDYKTSVYEAVERGAAAICIGKDKEVLPCDATFVRSYNIKRFLSAIAKNFYNNPSQYINLVGITGTHGKSTIAWMVRSILQSAGISTLIVGDSYYNVDDEQAVSGGDIFNPLTFTSILREAVDDRIKNGVVECSYTTIVQERFRHIWFDSLIYTDLYTYFKNQDMDCHYIEMRKTLIDHLKLSHSPIIVNMDDYHAQQLEGNNIIKYGLYGDFDIGGSDIELNSEGSRFILKTPKGDVPIELKCTGIHNIYNAMAAAAWGMAHDIAFEHIQKGIQGFCAAREIDGHLDIKDNIKFCIKDLHFIDRVNDICDELAVSEEGKVVTVFCAGAHRDFDSTNSILKKIKDFSHCLILTSDYSDRHTFLKAASQIKDGMGNIETYCEIDNYKALRKAVSLTETGDTILILSNNA